MHNDDAQQGKRKASQKTELVFWPRLHLPSFTKRIADAGNRVQQLMTMPEMARNTPSEPGNNVRAVMMPSTPFNFGESVVDHGQKSQKKTKHQMVKIQSGQLTSWSIVHNTYTIKQGRSFGCQTTYLPPTLPRRPQNVLRFEVPGSKTAANPKQRTTSTMYFGPRDEIVF
jgi:hypothetical protein